MLRRAVQYIPLFRQIQALFVARLYANTDLIHKGYSRLFESASAHRHYCLITPYCVYLIEFQTHKKAACKHTQDLQAEQGELLNFKQWFGRRF